MIFGERGSGGSGGAGKTGERGSGEGREAGKAGERGSGESWVEKFKRFKIQVIQDSSDSRVK